MVDPDGRAFYVKVGDAKDQQTVAEANATLDATQDSRYFWTRGYVSNFFAEITTDAFNVSATKISAWTVDKTNNPGDLGNDPIVPKYGVDFYVKLYDKDGNQVNEDSQYINVLGKTFKIADNKIEEASCDISKGILVESTALR